MLKNYLLFLGYSDEIPEEDQERELIMLSKGFEEFKDRNEIIPPDQCSYLTTFAYKSGIENAAINEITETWWEWTKKPIYLECITTEYKKLTKDQKYTFLKLKDGEWSYRSLFMVYKRNDEDALAEAKKAIIDFSTKKKWQFWI